MAITILTNPGYYNPAHHRIKWKFSMDDLGTLPDIIDFGFYLTDNSGTRLHKGDLKYRPSGVGVAFEKDFRTITQTLVSTAFPVDSINKTEDTTIIKKVKLKYGTVTYNGSTNTTTKAISTYTSPVNVINANANPDTLSRFNFVAGQTGLLLSERPSILTLNHGSKDFIWFLGDGTITIRYYNGATLVSTKTHTTSSAADKVYYVALDYLTYSLSNLTHATVQVDYGTELSQTFTILYQCPEDSTDYNGVLFLEPMGGRAFMATKAPESSSIDKSGQDITKHFDLNSTSIISGNRSLINTKSVRKLSFKATQEKSTGLKKFIENFFASPGHHLQKGVGNAAIFEKFILDPGSYTVLEKGKLIEISFSGYLAHDLNVQNEDI